MLREEEERTKQKMKEDAQPKNSSEALKASNEKGKPLWQIFQEQDIEDAKLKLVKAIAKLKLDAEARRKTMLNSEFDQFFGSDDNLIEPDHIRQIRKAAKSAALSVKKAFARPDEPQIRMPKITVDKKETKKRTNAIQALHNELTNTYPNDSFFETKKP